MSDTAGVSGSAACSASESGLWDALRSRGDEFRALREWRASRHSAAVVIQAHVRGHLARMRVREDMLVAAASEQMSIGRMRRALARWRRWLRVARRLQVFSSMFSLLFSPTAPLPG
ncbi:hypothetical protein FOA52_002410 [Chlamydomonas sp. UWO 241]|nr:hypothetical protein FOA52_002410 [Chlamydomonas sp. UWO 241]